VENLHHLPGLPLLEQLARTITLPLTHTLFAAVWGLGIARARLSPDIPDDLRGAWAGASVLAAVALHGLYDFILFAWEATWATSALALVLWLFVIYRAHALTREARWQCFALVGEFEEVCSCEQAA
jgi:RsiW-degrading membrane proteinase PrsW (M82 family)